MAEPILTVEHLVKGYGENTVLDDVSSVRPAGRRGGRPQRLRQEHAAALHQRAGAHPERARPPRRWIYRLRQGADESAAAHRHGIPEL